MVDFLLKLDRECQRVIDQGIFAHKNDIVPKLGPLFKHGAREWWNGLDSIGITWQQFERAITNHYQDMRLPDLLRKEEIRRMEKRKKETSRDYGARLQAANNQLAEDNKLTDDEMKFTFVSGHSTKDQERLVKLKIGGQMWHDGRVSFEALVREAYQKTNNSSRGLFKYRRGSTSSETDESDKSNSSSEEERAARRSRKGKRSSKASLLVTATPVSASTAVDNTVTDLKKTVELLADTIKKEQEVRAAAPERGGRPRGRVHLTELEELDDEDLMEEARRRGGEIYLSEAPRPRFPRWDDRRGGDRGGYGGNSGGNYGGPSGGAWRPRELGGGAGGNGGANRDLAGELDQLREMTRSIAAALVGRPPPQTGCYRCGGDHYQTSLACPEHPMHRGQGRVEGTDKREERDGKQQPQITYAAAPAEKKDFAKQG